MGLLGNVLDTPIWWIGSLFIWGLILFILIQILIQFEIIPRHNQPARTLWAQLGRVYEPLLRPIRQVLPLIGGFDLAPLVLVLGAYLARHALIFLL